MKPDKVWRVLRAHGPQTPDEIAYHWAVEGKPAWRNRKRVPVRPLAAARVREALKVLQEHGLVRRRDGAWIATDIPQAERAPRLRAANDAWRANRADVDVSPER